jgi:hypothetical protein
VTHRKLIAFCAFAGPVAFLAGQTACFAAVPAACRAGRRFELDAIEIVTLLVSLTALLIAARRPEIGSSAESEHAVDVFLARFALAGSALFSLVIATFWLSIWIYDPCQH